MFYFILFYLFGANQKEHFSVRWHERKEISADVNGYKFYINILDEKDLQRFKKIQKLTISSDFILLWAEKENFGSVNKNSCLKARLPRESNIYVVLPEFSWIWVVLI